MVEQDIIIPEVELVPLSVLKTDGDNPNRMTLRQKKALLRSIVKYGFFDPIVTNKDYLIADGEQRLQVAQTLKMDKAPVVRLDVSDIDRRMLRQILNKLRGVHLPELDRLEFQKILSRETFDSIKELLGVVDVALRQALKKDAQQKTAEQREPKPKCTLVECPKCRYQFSPAQFIVGSIDLEESYAVLPIGTDQALNKAHKVRFSLILETTTPNVTDRVIAVQEAFGIGIDEKVKVNLFQGLEVAYNDGDLIYLTGDSGSGKTTLLRLWEKHFKEQEKKTAVFTEIQPGPEEIVVEGIGEDIQESMSLLSYAGLSEAFLMVRRYRELSDGQKYRYRLAKLFQQDADVFLIDEFATSLDRTMAKVIAYTTRKWARRLGKMVIIATAHHDLAEDYNPDILIFKGFGYAAQVRYFETKPRPISLEKEIRLDRDTREDYGVLEDFHHLEDLGASQYLYKFSYRSEVVAVISYAMPFFQVSLRNHMFPEFRGRYKADAVNRDIIRISRVIVHPKYRGIGVGAKIVRETMPLMDRRIVETIAAMPKYNPSFEKAGMMRAGTIPYNPEQEELLETLKTFGEPNPATLKSSKKAKQFLANLTDEQAATLTEALLNTTEALAKQGYRGFNEALKILKQYEREGLLASLVELVPTERVYLYWENPEWREPEESGV